MPGKREQTILRTPSTEPAIVEGKSQSSLGILGVQAGAKKEAENVSRNRRAGGLDPRKGRTKPKTSQVGQLVPRKRGTAGPKLPQQREQSICIYGGHKGGNKLARKR